jgi:flavin-dependent dehydrogenase
LLVERGGFNEVRVGETLAPSVQPLLAALGVWHRFLALNPLPSWGTRSRWGGTDPQEHSHLFSPYGCGWHIDRQKFDRMIAETAAEAGATLCTDTRLLACEARGATGWLLTLAEDHRQHSPAANRETSHARSVTASVVVDATGRPARLARRLGARREVIDRLIGLTAQFAATSGNGECYTLVEAAPDGWWYSAPLGDGKLITMLMTDSDLCRDQKLALDDAWSRQLGDAQLTAARIGCAQRMWGPRPFSALSHRLVRDDSSTAWLAVGDAALAVDPASGSGVVRALQSAHAGASAILDHLQGSPTALREYEAQRDVEWKSYLEQRTRYYRMESRWAASPFWRRRAVEGASKHYNEGV